MDVQPVIPTCYRHADRETRLACSSCGRPVCVDCVQSAAVGQKCPECAAHQGRGQVITGADIRRRARRATPVTYTLIGVCVALWVLGFVAPAVGEALYLYGAQVNGAVAQGQWYRLFTAAFLHSPAGFTHILFNMYALYVFGPQLERETGSAPFAVLYVSAAVAGGALFFVLSGGGVAVGASGAIFGLFGAWIAAALRNRHTAAGRAGLRQLLVLLGINLALPLIIPNIAWEAHVGGLVAGFAIALAWWSPGLRRSPLTRALTAAVVGVASLSVVVL